MDIDICVANPAGNTTIFVFNDIRQSDYINIANKLLALKEYKAEQVAFIKNLYEKPYKMEMMGLEFCGNATRSFAYLVARENNLKTPTKIMVDVSGSTKLLEVAVDVKKNDATVLMPPPKRIDYIFIEDNKYPVVIMEGIIHVIIEDKTFDEGLSNKILDYILSIRQVDAIGLMFTNKDKMYPVVYVHNTKTLIHEGSCGSGSIAYAYYMFHDKDEKEHKIDIKQPGGILSVTINIADETKCFLGGAITFSDIETIKI